MIKAPPVDQDACKAALTDFAKSKWPYGIDELMFSSALRQRLASAAMRIVSIDDLRKKLSPACNLNTSSLRAHAQEIVSILQGIVSSTKSHLPILVPQNHAILPTHMTPNEPTQSALSVNEAPPQSTPTAELRAPAPNKTILSAPPVDEALNQPTPTIQLKAAPAPNKTILSAPPTDEDEAPNLPIPTTQLGAPALNEIMLLVLPADEAPNQPPPVLLQQDPARVPGTLPAPVPRGRPRGRGRGRPRRSRGQRQEYDDGGHSIGGGELID